MTKHFINKALENMDRFGGSFIQSLAVCYKKADPINKGRLFDTFKHLFNKYATFEDD